MNLYMQAAEQRLQSALNGPLPEASNTVGVIFNLSMLKIRRDNREHITIAANILRDILKASLGEIYVFSDGDIILINKSGNTKEVQESIYQMRYLFADDPLAFIPEGNDNDNFCSIYDTATNWVDFLKACSKKIKSAANTNVTPSVVQKNMPLLNIINSQIEEVLYDIDWDQIISKKYICTNPRLGKLSPIIEHITYNKDLLKTAMSANADIITNPHLSDYVEEFVQIRMMIKLLHYISEHPRKAFMLELTINTIRSDEFKIFDQALNFMQKKNLILNIHISEVFRELGEFFELKQQLINSGYKLCLIGLDNISFLQADRNLLGFDLMMISWESSLKKQSYESLFRELKSKVQVCGTSRVIMDNCDTNNALSIATSLGINLLEGELIQRLKEEI